MNFKKFFFFSICTFLPLGMGFLIWSELSLIHDLGTKLYHLVCLDRYRVHGLRFLIFPIQWPIKVFADLGVQFPLLTKLQIIWVLFLQWFPVFLCGFLCHKKQGLALILPLISISILGFYGRVIPDAEYVIALAWLWPLLFFIGNRTYSEHSKILVLVFSAILFCALHPVGSIICLGLAIFSWSTQPKSRGMLFTFTYLVVISVIRFVLIEHEREMHFVHERVLFNLNEVIGANSSSLNIFLLLFGFSSTIFLHKTTLWTTLLFVATAVFASITSQQYVSLMETDILQWGVLGFHILPLLYAPLFAGYTLFVIKKPETIQLSQISSLLAYFALTVCLIASTVLDMRISLNWSKRLNIAENILSSSQEIEVPAKILAPLFSRYMLADLSLYWLSSKRFNPDKTFIHPDFDIFDISNEFNKKVARCQQIKVLYTRIRDERLDAPRTK